MVGAYGVANQRRATVLRFRPRQHFFVDGTGGKMYEPTGCGATNGQER